VTFTQRSVEGVADAPIAAGWRWYLDRFVAEPGHIWPNPQRTGDHGG
jgi:hypothetical protein